MHNDDAIIPTIALLAFIDVHSALGALFGLCFWLALPSNHSPKQTFFFTVASFGLGYAAGVSVYANESQMLLSTIVSALGVSVLTSATGVIKDQMLDLLRMILNIRK